MSYEPKTRERQIFGEGVVCGAVGMLAIAIVVFLFWRYCY